MIFLALLALLGVSVQAQSIPFSFSYKVAGIAAQPVTNGGVITFPQAAGTPNTAVLAITNSSTDVWTVADVRVVGLGFTNTFTAAPVAVGASVETAITLTAKTDEAATGAAIVRLTGPSNQTITASFVLVSTVAPSSVATSYIMGFTGNQTAIANGESLQFPATAVGVRTSAVFVISNRGSAAAVISSVLSPSGAFDLAGLPLFPVTLTAGQELRFNVGFTPSERDTYTGSFSLNIDGAVKTFRMQGQGSGALLTYQLITPGNATMVAPEGTISFPAATVGRGNTTVTLRIVNTGNSEGRIGVITVTGTNFQLLDVPGLPLSIAPNASVSLTLVFAPKEVGDLTGRLRIENAQFNLAGVGMGAKYSVSLLNGGTRMALTAGVLALLPNTTVGDKYAFQVEVVNTGNQVGTLTSIGFSGIGFTTSQLPVLPARVEENGVLRFDVLFVPTAVSVATGFLQVDDQSFTIRAVGSQPPALPAVTFTGASDKIDSLSQPGVGLTLASAYPYQISGKLALSFSSDSFIDDPAIQFVSGGRSIDFVIPANSTQAVFGLSARQIQFQSGSVAGVVKLEARFTVGTVDLSPAAPALVAMTVPAAEPVIRSIQVSRRSGNSLELAITGYSTSRRVTQLDFQFSPAPNTTLKTTNLSVNVDSAFTKWYASSDSRFYGSQFTLTVQFDLTGNANSLAAVTVTATNPKGVSAPKMLKLLQ